MMRDWREKRRVRDDRVSCEFKRLVAETVETDNAYVIVKSIILERYTSRCYR